MDKKMFILEVFPERSVLFQPLSLDLKQELISVSLVVHAKRTLV